MNSNSKKLRPLMVLGCSSDAGKSLITTALCRWFRRRGVDVAPFKAQNMSNNARVVDAEDGVGEIGVAQWLQARAAQVEPHVRMNPVLVKPDSEVTSQVVVRGRADLELSRIPWEHRHDAIWKPMAASFDELRDRHELVVLEGAGSPAEINLRDQVNNRMVEYADAAAMLVADIDRGGSFAHLYGTWSLVPESTRSRIGGYILNKFRGDAGLLAPGPEMLTKKTGMEYLGHLPALSHRLPREEGAREVSEVEPATDCTVMLPRFPFGSNLDEFGRIEDLARVRWVSGSTSLAELNAERDLLILPGSKSVARDYAWLEARGFVPEIRRAAQRGVRVLGVCGGAMMLGTSLHDPDGVEGGGPKVETLGLLDLTTRLSPSKRVDRVAGEFSNPGGSFGNLRSAEFEGYEIRFGELSGTAARVGAVGTGSQSRPVAWSDGTGVLATTVHGLFEQTSFLERVFGVRPPDPLEETLEQLADAVEEFLDTERLLKLVRT